MSEPNCHICKRPLDGPGWTYCSAAHGAAPVEPQADWIIKIVERKCVSGLDKHWLLEDWRERLTAALASVPAPVPDGGRAALLGWLKSLESCVRYGTKLNESDLGAIEQVRAIIASVPAPPGFVTVPVEPTSAMTIAGGEAQQQSIGSWGEPKVVWWAMIAAAPTNG